MKDRKTGIDPVEVVKVADPALQMLLLILFFLSADLAGHNARYLFLDLLVLQLISSIVNLFLQFQRKRVVERIAFFVVLGIYAYIYYYVKTHIQDEHFTGIDMQVWTKGGKNDFYLLLAGISIAIWYLALCLREARSLFRKKRRNRD